MFKTKVFKRGVVILSTITLLLASTATMAQAATLTNVTVTPSDPNPGATTTWSVSFSGGGIFDCVSVSSVAISGGAATYATSTSPAAIPVTNGTATPGTLVTVETLTGGCSGTVVDTGTSAVSLQNDTTVRLTVDGSFTFNVGARNDTTACSIGVGAVANTSATDLNLGSISGAAIRSAVNDLSVTSNAHGGWDVNARVTPMSGAYGTFTNTSGFSAANAEGTYSVVWDGSAPNNATHQYVGNTNGSYLVSTGSSPTGSTATQTCVGFQAQAGTNTPAGAYSSTVTYTAVPKY